MHEAGILDAVRKRASRIRGGVAVFNRLNPRQTAHIVVDLQNGFMDHGSPRTLPSRTFVTTASEPGHLARRGRPYPTQVA